MDLLDNNKRHKIQSTEYISSFNNQTILFDAIHIWNQNEISDFFGWFPTDEKDVCLLSEKPTDIKNKPAVIICPGGGYEHLSIEKEGIRMAEVLKNAGYHPFVLTYRVSPCVYPSSHLDLACAVKYVRAHADYYGIDPNNIMIMGASAGGHLCASFALIYKELDELLLKTIKDKDLYKDISIKPNKLALSYPVISLVKEFHKGSMLYLTDGDQKLAEKLSVDLHIDSDYPKTFIWACEDDASVPISNTLRMGKALEENGIEYKMEVFPSGGHGCGLALDTSAHSWMEDLIEYMK